MLDSEYDIPLDDLNASLVTIEEMKELLAMQQLPIEELQKAPNTGLFYTDYFAKEERNMLQEHLLIEQCMEHLDELDWPRITNGYSLYIIPRLQHLWENPLVWLDNIPNELTNRFVITGKVAEEKSSELRNTCMPYDSLYMDLQQQRILWFADNLPTRKDMAHDNDYWNIPSDFILWSLLITDPDELFLVNLYHSDTDPHLGTRYWPYCNAEHFRHAIEIVRTNRSQQQAAKIVKLLREDWSDIKAMKLFGIDRCTQEQVDEFEQALFAGMDRNLRKWDTEKKPTVDFESVFSLRYRRTEDYNRLLQFLESERLDASDNDWARYALALYHANIFVHRPAGFTKWLPKFCELFGRDVTYREPSTLNRTKCQKDITAFLPDW